ncbi:unnamed protein product [Vitrella brassicaformis CCMP3155]|uniref:Uncharacterized protein n=1 Tax=Vitrella brassicaformis (strain CCMP3155) TaxID=1169540 RepID=A0A0G4FQK9_VITBC|nr:unnamed protein product [Vitrella brassicaformis CCMP3155]|eukprot:CEM16724.1 unnamed protein product [Vitrella brassicaformis CCMP3155]
MLKNKSTNFSIMKAADGTRAAVTQQTTLAITRDTEGPLSDVSVTDMDVPPLSGTLALHAGGKKGVETALTERNFGVTQNGPVTIDQQVINNVVADGLEVGQSGDLMLVGRFDITHKSDLVVPHADGSTTVHVATEGKVFPHTKGPSTHPTTITVTAVGYAAMEEGGTTITPTGGVLSYTYTITGNRDLTVVLKTSTMDPMLASLSAPVANGYKKEGSDADSDKQDWGDTVRRDPQDVE